MPGPTDRRPLVGTPGLTTMKAAPSHLLPGGSSRLPEVFRKQRSGPQPLLHIEQWTHRVLRWIPPHSSILDIGCGIGVVARSLAHAHEGRLHLTLLDKTGDDPHVPMSATGYRHNDLDITRQWVADLDATVHDVDQFDWAGEYDIVMSTLSWGFHYPLSLYLDRVLALRPRLIIVDLRNVVEIPGLRIRDRFHIWGKATTVVYERR